MHDRQTNQKRTSSLVLLLCPPAIFARLFDDGCCLLAE